MHFSVAYCSVLMVEKNCAPDQSRGNDHHCSSHNTGCNELYPKLGKRAAGNVPMMNWTNNDAICFESPQKADLILKMTGKKYRS